MTVDTLIARALSAIGKKTVYKSPGIMPSFDASVWPDHGASTDCSGYIAWCLRFPGENRKVNHPLYDKVNSGWFETTAIHADGLSSTGFFTRLNLVKPGALLVYPDYKGSDGKFHDGHVGIVIEGAGKSIDDVTKIVHCSVSNSKKGDAIQITKPNPWLAHKDSIVVWFDSIT